MSRSHRMPRGILALLPTGTAGPTAHEEWNNLHVVYSAKTSFTYPFGGRTPRVGPGSGPSFGQVRKLHFSADGEYVGSGDSSLHNLRVSDCGVLWRTFAGGWPFVNGIDLTPDGAWLVAGTHNLDATFDSYPRWHHAIAARNALRRRGLRTRRAAPHDTRRQVYRTTDGSLAGMTKSAGSTLCFTIGVPPTFP